MHKKLAYLVFGMHMHIVICACTCVHNTHAHAHAQINAYNHANPYKSIRASIYIYAEDLRASIGHDFCAIKIDFLDQMPREYWRPSHFRFHIHHAKCMSVTGYRLRRRIRLFLCLCLYLFASFYITLCLSVSVCLCRSGYVALSQCSQYGMLGLSGVSQLLCHWVTNWP